MYILLVTFPLVSVDKELDPEEFICFKDHAVITKADVRLYEEELKEELKSWIECNHKQEVFPTPL